MEDRQSWFENRRLSQYLDNVRTHYLDNPEIAIEDWKVIRMALIRLAMSKLDPLEKQITRRLNFDGLSEREVATELKLSSSKVHRVKWRAIKKLSDSIFLKLALAPFPGVLSHGETIH